MFVTFGTHIAEQVDAGCNCPASSVLSLCKKLQLHLLTCRLPVVAVGTKGGRLVRFIILQLFGSPGVDVSKNGYKTQSAESEYSH